MAKHIYLHVALAAIEVRKLGALKAELELPKARTDSLNEALKVSRRDFAAVKGVLARVAELETRVTKLEIQQEQSAS